MNIILFSSKPYDRASFQALRNGLQVVRLDGVAVLVPQQVLQKHLHGDRQRRNAGKSRFLRRREAVVSVGLVADSELPARLQGVHGRHIREILLCSPPP